MLLCLGRPALQVCQLSFEKEGARGRKKQGRRETKRERGGGQEREEDIERWKMMALRISILRWDTFSIIEFSLRSPPLCLSLREHRCHFVFSQGWVKLGANPSCSAQGTHKQHNVTSYSLPSTWKFRGRCLQPSESRGCLLSNLGLSVFQKNENHCWAVPVKVTYTFWKTLMHTGMDTTRTVLRVFQG